MAKYVVHLELVAVRVAEASSRELKTGEDPLNAMATASLKFLHDGPPMSGPPPGVTLRKSFPLTAESFASLCEILGRFDDLAERVECEHP
jgi:hypothetical protein